MRRGRRRPPLPPPWLVRGCGELYRACVEAAGEPDKVLARAFREDGRLGGEHRGFVADTVQGMLRARGLIEAALRHVGGAQEQHAALVYLRARRGIPAGPRDAELGRAIAAAEKETHRIDGFFPDWLRRALPGGDALLRAMAAPPPVTLRANLLRVSCRDLADWLAHEGIAAEPTRFSPWGLTLESRANVFRTEAFREGAFEMQDEGSQLVALLCGARPGQVVVDGCAGAGGKTLALAAAMRGDGTLVALDTARFRLEELRKRAERAGVRNLEIHEAEPLILSRFRGRADVVLADAPCSGTGVLRRNPDIAWKLEERAVARLVDEQARILDLDAPLVRPGGRLVYAVCSLIPAEGRSQAERFLRDHPEFRRADAGRILKSAGVDAGGLVADGDFQVDPLRHGMDGFYAAVFERARSAERR
ncbi:MAG: RsmB/NOP family class I SAM-dependent RNA methyltransferase [Planctomycetia bacterium]|nr:RsmB/NOP family class I SAM-dependent RNA methyltransferase [Planctomycetia bacterium]